MSKDLFQFKQFTVYQKDATLKICTDSCLFGAWIASQKTNTGKVLDIGSGTGLLGLMYVQQNESCSITGLEIDGVSSELTSLNFESSPWRLRLKSVNNSLQNFVHTQSIKYDIIICNPPFFENQLESSKSENNLAKHSSELKREELLAGVLALIEESGVFYILLPPAEAILFKNLAVISGLYLSKMLKVKNFENTQFIRFMMEFQKQEGNLNEEEICIYSAPKIYSESFCKLLKDYYLYL